MAFEGNIVFRISSLLLPVLPIKDTNANTVNLSKKPAFPVPYDPEAFYLWKKIYFPSVVDEENPISSGALRFPYILLQDLVLFKSVPLELKGSESEYMTLRNNIMDPKNRYAKPYVRMMTRLEIFSYDAFESVAHDLCGFTSCTYEYADEKMSWSTITSIFTFAVCLAHKYREDEDRVEEVSRYLAKYIINYPLSFVTRRGGWGAIVKEHPANPRVEEAFYSDRLFNLYSLPLERKRKKKSSITTNAVLWSGLCVGSVATTMFLLTRNK